MNHLTYFYVNLTFMCCIDTKAKVEADEAAALVKKNRESATKTLVSSLEAAIAASDKGIAKTLDGLSIGKTAAKKEWNVDADQLEKLSPVDSSKKLLKYHLSDVIRVAHERRHYSEQHISIRIKQKGNVTNAQQYARYLHDAFLEARTNVIKAVDDEDESEAIINAAYEEVRKKTSMAVKSKKEAVKTAQAELTCEENRHSALENLVEDCGDDIGKKKASVASAAGSKKASSAGVNENVANDSKKPAAKKRKVAPKKKVKASEEDDDEYDSSGDELLKSSSGLSKRSRRNKTTVSYADENSEDEDM